METVVDYRLCSDVIMKFRSSDPPPDSIITVFRLLFMPMNMHPITINHLEFQSYDATISISNLNLNLKSQYQSPKNRQYE